MTIYEIDAALQALVDPETGELLDYDEFASLSMERDKKIEGMAVWAKNCIATAKAIKEEETALKARREKAEHTAERLKVYLSELLCGEKFETAKCSIGFRKSTALDVSDVAAAAKWLDANGHKDLVVQRDPAIDKRAVSAIVKSGIPIPGCKIVERNSLQLR